MEELIHVIVRFVIGVIPIWKNLNLDSPTGDELIVMNIKIF